MSEHLTQNQVEGYCQRQLRSTELLSVSDHLSACEACRLRIQSAVDSDMAFFAVRSEVLGETAQGSSPYPVRTHPSVEQTAGFVDGSLAGEALQSVTDHLTNCALCALAVEDLRAFKNQVAPSLGREYRPAADPIPTKSWLHRATASLPALFRGSPALAFGAALTVLLLAVTGWLIWRTIREPAPKEEIAVTPTPTPAPAPAPQSPPPSAPMVAQLNDGHGQLTMDQEGNLTGADDLPLDYQSKLKKALTNPRIEASPHLKGLARPPSALMGTDHQGSEFFVVEPVGKVVIADQPLFRWSRLDGATSYVVEVYDEKFRIITTSPQLTTTSWRASQKLGRGGVYSWQVKAIKEGQEFTSPRPPAPQAKFRILDQANANELAKAKRAYPSSHLTMGLLYAEAGLLNEAEQEFRVLQKANPDSEIARKLLSQVQALRR